MSYHVHDTIYFEIILIRALPPLPNKRPYDAFLLQTFHVTCCLRLPDAALAAPPSLAISKMPAAQPRSSSSLTSNRIVRDNTAFARTNFSSAVRFHRQSERHRASAWSDSCLPHLAAQQLNPVLELQVLPRPFRSHRDCAPRFRPTQLIEN